MGNKKLEKEVKDLDDCRKGCIERFHSASKEMDRLAKENRSNGYYPFLGTGLSMEQIIDMVSNGVKAK